MSKDLRFFGFVACVLVAADALLRAYGIRSSGAIPADYAWTYLVLAFCWIWTAVRFVRGK